MRGVLRFGGSRSSGGYRTFFETRSNGLLLLRHRDVLRTDVYSTSRVQGKAKVRNRQDLTGGLTRPMIRHREPLKSAQNSGIAEHYSRRDRKDSTANEGISARRGGAKAEWADEI